MSMDVSKNWRVILYTGTPDNAMVLYNEPTGKIVFHQGTKLMLLNASESDPTSINDSDDIDSDSRRLALLKDLSEDLKGDEFDETIHTRFTARSQHGRFNLCPFCGQFMKSASKITSGSVSNFPIPMDPNDQNVQGHDRLMHHWDQFEADSAEYHPGIQRGTRKRRLSMGNISDKMSRRKYVFSADSLSTNDANASKKTSYYYKIKVIEIRKHIDIKD